MEKPVQIVPTLNVISENNFIQNLRAIESHANLIQIDIADGIFTSWQNWHDPNQIAQLQTSASYELHLMVDDPLVELKKWETLNNIKRIAVHVESFDSSDSLLEIFHALTHFPYEISIAINPDTDIALLDPILPNLSYLMFLGVNPGKSGQQFQKKILKNILEINQAHDHIQIEVDGGVNADNIQEVVAHGADIICMGSAIFSGDTDPVKNLEHLKSLL